MAKKRHTNRVGASTIHSVNRTLKQCGFKGSEKEARRLIAKCRKAAGRNGSIIISSQNIGVSSSLFKRWKLEDNRYYISFMNGKSYTVLDTKIK